MGRKKNSVDATRRPETRAQTIRLKLENSHGGVADFVTSPTGSFSFAFALYPTGTRLTYKGAEIRADQTPEELGMQDGDTIVVTEPNDPGLVRPRDFEELEPDAEVMNLRLADANGTVVDVHTNPTDLFVPLIFEWAKANHTPADWIHFTYNGEEVVPDQTPEELGMQDGDTLTVVVSQNNLEPANAGLVHPNVFGGQVINLRLADANGNEVDVQTNPTVPLITLTIEWSMAVLTPAPATSIHFTYNGTEVGLDQTPAELGMRDGDTLMVTVD